MDNVWDSLVFFSSQEFMILHTCDYGPFHTYLLCGVKPPPDRGAHQAAELWSDEKRFGLLEVLVDYCQNQKKLKKKQQNKMSCSST